MFESDRMRDKVFRNPDLVRTMIRKRAEIEHFDSQGNTEMYHTAPTYIDEKKEIKIYSDLDRLIAGCKFDVKSLRVIQFVQQGYSLRAISEKLNIDNSNISKRLNTICRKIVKEYELQLLIDEAKRTKADCKKCTKCGEYLPVSSEFFSYDKSNQCYKSSCKKCRKG